jgi:recombination protein RecA
MTEQDRQRAIRLRLCRAQSPPGRPADAVMPTGFAALDAALGGGFPRGRILELFGPPSCGKTTLALQAAAHLQANGLTVGWIDADHTFDPAYAAALGISIERLVVLEPAFAEEALEMARRLAASAALDLLVIDSAAALVPKLELETGIGESGLGLQARVLASGLRRLAAEAARAGLAALFLNQMRGRPEAGEEETTAGGPALKLYAAARIALGPAAGARVRFRILKNKAAASFAAGQLEWRGAKGFAESP